MKKKTEADEPAEQTESMEFYKRHRPRSFERVIGMTETVAALQNMVKRNTLPHAVMFTGPTGCGKTTLARITARAIGAHELAISEMNSSSYRGIDSIRELQRRMLLSPPAGPYRVWILDEVHMLTKDAQNAALKMLEDTPRHVYFFLCSNEPEKLLATVSGRCHPMPVRAMTYEEQEQLLQRVAKKEGIELQDKIKPLLIDSANGSARVLLVLLEKIANLSPKQQATAIEQKLAESVEGIDLCRALMKPDRWKRIAELLRNLKGEPETIRRNVLGYARAVLLNKGDWNAYNVITCFSSPFYDTGAPGLAAACYEVACAKET